jgi:tryptophan synthase alpha chain
MNDFEKQFLEVKKENRCAFMPFVVAGDPNFKASVKIATRLGQIADFLEIGFPYSDPLADGPTIQAADNRALQAGVTTAKVFKLIKNIRKQISIPITVLVYANLVLQYGANKFYRDARRAGINGVLIPDAPAEEAAPFVRAAKQHGICPIFLVTQTTTKVRLKKILKYAQGYLYLVSVLGVTGSRKTFSQETTGLIKRVKTQTRLPLAVGFGISQPRQAKEFYRAGADGAIVGSAIIDMIAKHQPAGKIINFAKKFLI